MLGGREHYQSARAKSSEIRHPVVRYLHRTLANTMFAKKANGPVNERKLKILDKALCDYLIYSSEGTGPMELRCEEIEPTQGTPSFL